MKFAKTLACSTLVASAAVAAPTASKVNPLGKSSEISVVQPEVRQVENIMDDPIVQAYLGADYDHEETVPEEELADQFRIVGGIKARSEFPWFASLNTIIGFGGNGRASIGLCGGSLINEHWVLTAAHCFFDVDPETKGAYFQPKYLQVGPGPNDVLPNLLVQVGGSEQRFMIDNGIVRRSTAQPRIPVGAAASPSTFEHRAGVEILCHPNYDPQRQINDICLVKLDAASTHTPVRLNFETATRTAAQVALNNAPGQESLAVGYGNTAFEGDTSANLLEATMPLVTLDQCKKQWAYASYGPIALSRPAVVNNVLGNDVVCAGSELADTCQGDSGGPLVNVRTGVQIGVTSMGINCRSGIPGVYTKVSSFQNWILATVGPTKP